MFRIRMIIIVYANVLRAFDKQLKKYNVAIRVLSNYTLASTPAFADFVCHSEDCNLPREEKKRCHESAGE